MPVPSSLMALPVISNVFRCTLHWAHTNGQRAVNVTHVSAPTKTAAQVFTQWDTSVANGLWIPVVSGARVVQFDVLPLDGSSPTTINTVPSVAKWTGNGGAVDFLPQGSALVKFQTALRGPAHRGRMFLPFLSEQEQSNGAIVAGDLATMQTAWNTFRTNMAAAGVALVVATYAHADKYTVDSVVCESEIGTQRRRQKRNRT
jgi:hypothetical protein